MASISGIFPTTQTDATGTSAASALGASTGDPTQSLGNEQNFLQLLVAQLKNQDPTQPQDGTQFVSQLAQFSNLEQSIGMHKDLDSINADITAPGAASGTAASGNSGAAAQNQQSGTTGTQQAS